MSRVDPADTDSNHRYNLKSSKDDVDLFSSAHRLTFTVGRTCSNEEQDADEQSKHLFFLSFETQ